MAQEDQEYYFDEEDYDDDNFILEEYFNKKLSRYNNDDQPNIDNLSLDDQKKKHENDRYKEDTEIRRKFSLWIRRFIPLWMAVIFLVLSLNDMFIHLSDDVLMMLLGTTTIKILGLPYVVLKDYFKNNHK